MKSQSVQLLHRLGLHPIVAFGVVLVDWMLFAGETSSLGALWPVSLVVAAALTIPSTLIQKYAYAEPWGLAIGKALMVGILTAIPTPLPSAISVITGALGSTSLLLDRRTSAER
jgi:hypothetical protein